MLSLPEPGQLVDVRRRRYVVLEITESTLTSDARPVAPVALPRHHLVTLSSVEDDALGEEIQVIWEIEPGATPIEKTPLPAPIGFDTPQRLDTFLNAVRWGAASSADVRAIQMPRVNLLIADDAGLGKTIEAGLVAQELMIRYRAPHPDYLPGSLAGAVA